MSWAHAQLVATLHAITHNSEESHVRKYGTKFWFSLQIQKFGQAFQKNTLKRWIFIVKHTGPWEKSKVFGYNVNAANVWYEIVLSSCPSESPVFGALQDHYFNHKASQTLSNVMQKLSCKSCCNSNKRKIVLKNSMILYNNTSSKGATLCNPYNNNWSAVVWWASYIAPTDWGNPAMTQFSLDPPGGPRPCHHLSC